MDKAFKEKLKKELESEKTKLEERLSQFADKDDKVPGNWNTRYTQATDNVDDDSIEDATDQVEKYSNLLSVEHSLEKKLQEVDASLEKIDSKEFGTCSKCGGAIAKERLEVNPSAQTCMKCN
jgi:RNA polymerase-binding transcription factor DksA